MSAIGTVESPKTVSIMPSGTQHASRRARLEAEEAALKELLAKEQGVDEDVKPEEDEQELDTKAEDQTDEVDEEEDKQLSTEEQTFKKRYGDLRRHSQQKEKELDDRIKALESQLQSTKAPTMPKTDEEIEEWAKEYPDVAAIFETIAEKKASEKVSNADERLKLLEEKQTEMKKAEAIQAIRKSHPDFDTLRDSDEFHDWVAEQSKWIQNALYENAEDPVAVIRVIDLYKVDNDMTPSAKKAKTKEAAKEIRTTTTKELDTDTKPTFSESQIRKNGPDWYAKNEDKIQKAMKDGRFSYDISGGAR